MTVSTLRPDGTSIVSASVTGAVSAHAALSDDSDSSYITCASGDLWRGTFDDFTLPAGAVIKSVSVRARTAQSGGSVTVHADLVYVVGVLEKTEWRVVSWAVPTTTVVIGEQTTPDQASAFGNPPSPLTDSILDGIQVRLIGEAGTLRVYEAYVEATYVAKPDLAVVAPIETVGDTNLPTVIWAPTLDEDGGEQSRFEVKVFTDAQYGAGGFNPATSTPTATSGIVESAADSWQVPEILADDTYRAYVRIAQTVNGELLWSAREYTDFDLDVDVPAVPTLDVEADNENARHIIVISDQPGDADTHYWEVERSTDGGTTWAPMRQLVPGLFHTFGLSLTLYDYEAPPFPVGTQVDETLPIPAATQYRARALHDYGGVLAAGEWAFGDAAWSTADWWLKHPNRPDLNVRVTVHSYASIKRSARQGVLQPLGARFPVVVSDTRGPATAQIVLRSDTAGDQAALDALLETNGTLLLQGPANEKPPGYIVISDHDRQRWVDLGRVKEAREVLEFTIVDRPPGNVVAWP